MWQNIKQLYYDAFWADKLGKLIGFLSLIAPISGITLKELFKDNYDVFQKLDWSDTISLGLIIILIRMTWICAKRLQESEFVKQSAYTPTKMMRHIREIIVLNNSLITRDRQQEDVLAELCNKLRDCMDKLTESRCCVSIKLIEGHEDGDYVMTFQELNNQKVRNIARDNNHRSRDTDTYKNTEHFISANTAFFTITAKIQKGQRTFYRNNYVRKDTDYQTSSPYEDGTVPYESELVFPIIKRLDNDQINLKGYLCVDSDTENAFKKDSLILDLMDTVADSLFWIITYND